MHVYWVAALHLIHKSPTGTVNHSSNVLVFGGSGIIGGAIATAFGEEGWTVGIHYHHNQPAAIRTASTMGNSGGKGYLYQADVANSGQVHRIIQDFTEMHHGLNVLVWAVGVGSSRLLIKTTSEEWTRSLQTNLTGAYHVLQAIAPILEQQQDGAVILLGSLSGEQGDAGQAAYAASKAGLIGLMRTAAQEWGAFNIRVNVIFPGWQISPLSEPGFHSAMERHPHTLRQPPSLKAVATSVYHLALSPYTSGQVWNLDSRIW
jgi:3-oxoacyl-[acyl-carrier protein] reductase